MSEMRITAPETKRHGVTRRRLMQATAAATLPLPSFAQNKPIRMGWIAAISGMFASNAQAQDWGFHMAVADLNEQGGLLGRKIEIILRDSPAAMLCIVLIRATFDPQGD